MSITRVLQDYESLKNSPGPLARQIVADLSGGIQHVKASVTLLELSIIGLTVERTVPRDEIGENDGPQCLARFLWQPGYEFALRYTKLPRYGEDAASDAGQSDRVRTRKTCTELSLNRQEAYGYIKFRAE